MVAAVRGAVETSWREAQRALPDPSASLDLDAFAADVLRLWQRGRRRLGLPDDVALLVTAVPRLHLDDLYLARRCDRGDPSAWRALMERHQPELLRGLSRHVDVGEAERIAAGVLADASLPPPRSPGRTMLGTYEGSGPLSAWLQTIGLRRAREPWGGRERPLHGTPEPVTTPGLPDSETRRRAEAFGDALREGWSLLEPREGLALLWKHRDGLTQREVARLLGVSEPTTTRLLQRAVAKLRGHLLGRLPGGPEADPGLWARLEQALVSHLEIQSSLRHPGTKPS